SAEPGAVVPPAAISTHFVLVVDPSVDEPTNVASSRDFSADCGSTAVGGLNQTGFAAWSECVARHYVEEVNGAFASLLGSSAPMLQFGSFSVLAKPELARGRLRNELPQAIEPLAEPGGLSIFLVMDMADANGGIARRSQAYPDAFKGASVAMEAESTWQIMAHELGHAIGFSHVSGPNVEAVASYECCGGAQAATVRGDCDETSNIMCEVGGLENTFDTCEHGAFLKKIARCWLGGNGGPNCSSDACVLGDPAAVRCKNAAGGVRCTCLANSMTYSALDCNDAVSQIFTACKGPSCDPFGPNLCASGAACYPTASGDNQCAIAGSAKVGSACNRPNECAPGALCVGAADGTSKCGLLCDRVGGADPFAACPADCGEVSVLSEDLAICVP
ncbi:MAG TPA: M12 family metallo-peptidase, partial [Polyangiaceae bacterium]|nr:M12 family metallo-peptidase [Polyangiaceae bacterium]